MPDIEEILSWGRLKWVAVAGMVLAPSALAIAFPPANEREYASYAYFGGFGAGIASVVAAAEMFNRSMRPKSPLRALRNNLAEVYVNRLNGSGIAVTTKGDVITAYHLVDGQKREDPYIQMPNGTVYRPHHILTDPEHDIALIVSNQPGKRKRSEPRPSPELPNKGAEIAAMGYRNGELWQSPGEVTYHNGHPNFRKKKDFLTTNARVKPGFSGGAVATADGGLIGITISYEYDNGRYRMSATRWRYAEALIQQAFPGLEYQIGPADSRRCGEV